MSRSEDGATVVGPPHVQVLNPQALGRAFAAVRILLGLTYLLNGLAKFFDVRAISLLGFRASLIGREDALGIMQRQGLDSRGGQGTAFPLIQPIARFMIDNYDVAKWFLATAETVAGVLLVIGLASRAGALLALLLALYVQGLYFSSGAWLFEEPLIWVPLLILTIVASGRVWGLDGGPARRRLADGKRVWPF